MHLENIHQAKSHLSKLIAEALAGEEIIICKAGRPVVRIIPYEERVWERVPGSLKGKITMSEDFDILPTEILSQFEGA